MRKTFKLVLVFFLFFSGWAFSAEAAERKPASQVSFIEVLPLSVKTLDEVIKNHANDFRALKDGTVLIRNMDNLLWIRIPTRHLKNIIDSSSYLNALLVLQCEYISRVDFYRPVGLEMFEHSIHGFNIPLVERSFPSRYPVFGLKHGGTEGFVYLRIQTDLPVGFNIAVEDERIFHYGVIERLSLYMAFYSFLGALALTYLFFYFTTGDRYYFIGVLRQFGILVFLFSFNGYLQYYFNLPPETIHTLSGLGLALYCFAEVTLWKKLLPADTPNLWLKYLTALHVFIGALIVFTAFLGKSYFIFPITLLALGAVLLSILFTGVMNFRRGSRPILFFAASRIAFLVGFMFLFLDMLFVSRGLYLDIFMTGLLLDPVFLACMLIPSTRHRLNDYTHMERKSLYYEDLSQKDSMTGLYNKANLLSILEKNIELTRITQRPLAFVMIDIDHFKRYNDTWGHPEGDRALLFLAEVIRKSLRGSDIAARYGGEEFSVILPGVTQMVSIIVAERIRKSCETQSKALGEEKAFTLSLGLAFFRPGDDAASLVRRADKALYRAKASGRNRIEYDDFFEDIEGY